MADAVIKVWRPAVFARTADYGSRCWCGYYISGTSTTSEFAELEHRIEHIEKFILESENG